MSRGTEKIEQEIEQARNQLANTLDELVTRADPEKLVETGKSLVLQQINRQEIRLGAAIVVGSLVALIVLKKIIF